MARDDSSDETNIICTKCGHVTQGVIRRTFLYAPADVLDRDSVMALARMIRREGARGAEEALEYLFRDEPEIREWVALGLASA